MKINRWTFLVVVALVGAFFISNIKLTMSQTAPPTPTITQPANGANPPLPINIYWSGAVSPYYYTLWRNNTAVSGCIDVPYTTTQCMDTGANGTVSYTMVACTGPGASNNSSSSGPCMGSNAVSVTVGSPPPAPSSVTATLLSGKVSVTWPSSGAPKYSVWRSINGGTFQQLSAQIINTYFDDVSVTQGTAYQYWVFGCASDGFTCPLSPTVSNSVTYTGGANNAPPVPSTPTPTSYSGAIGAPYSYSTNLYPDPDGNQVKAVFDWGDGTTNESSLLTPYSGGISVTMAHIWNSSNIYTIKVKAVDSTGLYSSWSGAATMTIGNPPTAPVLTSAVANGSSVTMNWTENSTNVTGFKLYRRMTSPSVSIQALPDAGASVRTYTDYGFPNNTGLAAGTYEYYLQAYNLSGGGTYPIYSGASNIITVTISGGTSDTQAPTVPAGLAATATSPSQINLSWSPSTDNVGVVGYKIYRNGTFWYQTASLSFSDTGLTSNTTYGYAVFAYDAAGNPSALSSAVSATTPGGSVSCSGLTLTLQNNKTTYVIGETVTYTYICSPGGSTSYVEVQVVNPSGTPVTYNTASGNISTNTMGFGTSNLSPGNYTLRTCFTTGCSTVTASIPFTVVNSTSVPPPPYNPTASFASNGTAVNLSWNGTTTNVTSFRIFNRPQGTTSWPSNYESRAMESLLSNSNNIITVQIGLINGASGTYEYMVVACNSAGCSAGSSVASITVGGTSAVPAAPSNLTGSASGNNVNLNWTDNANNEAGFKLYRGPVWTDIGNVGANTTVFTDMNLAAGTYIYRLNAFNYSSGTYPVYSGISNDYSVTVSGGGTSGGVVDTTAPSQPTLLVATKDASNEVDLKWNASTDNVGVAGYFIYRSYNGGWGQVGYTATTTFMDFSVTPSTPYYYSVAAYDAAGNRSASSTPLFLNTPAAAASSTATSTGSSLPAAPSSLAGSFAANGVDINFSWRNNADNALGFKISRRQIGGSWADAGSVPASSTSFINFAVPVGSWEYHVNACNMNGCSLDSNSVFFTVSSSANYSTSTMPGGYATSTIPYPTPYPSPQPTPTPIPAANAILSGTVFDGSGQAVSAAGIHIFTEDFNLNFGGATDTNGSFSFQIPSGSYKVEVYSAQSRNDLVKPAPLAVSVAAGETKRITIRFAANAKTVSGVASFSNGKPIIDAEVGAYSTDSHQWVSTFVDSSGRYALKVGGGRWQMGIRPRDAGIAKWSWHGAFPQAEFANDANAESQTVNFTIPVFDSNLIVHAVDESGNVLPEVGVIVDTTSPKDTGSQTDRLPPQFKKTGSDGVARFTLQSQTYFVRAVVASGKGYSNPEEVSVSLAPAEEKSLTLVFRKIQSVQTVALKGKARLERGLPIDAFIWSWSEKGGFMQTSANASGEFSLSLVANDRWHIGAGKKIGDFPYKSSEVIVDTGKEVASLEIVLSREGEDALPPAVTVTQAANQTVVAEAQDGARITLPPASVASAGNIKLEVNPTVEAPSQAAAKVVGTVYDIKVRDDKDKQVTQFSQDIEIILPYKDENLKAFKVKAEGLIPSYFDESTGSWVKLDNYTIDQERHVVIARVKHLTRFALVSAADTVPPAAPDKASVKRASSGLLVSWVNPTADFDHVKIYRSTEAGSLGTVLYNNIVSNSQLDSSTKTGTKYYYTVRAVDPAGNESVNVNQISGSGVARVAITFKRALKVGSRGDDVSLLQQILINEEVYPGGSVTGYFGQKTKEAVKKLQEKYKDDILTPAGLTAGNGTIGTGTRKKLNTLIP